ncbi:MAG: Mor transcription activator family protein [Paraclostridium sp.]
MGIELIDIPEQYQDVVEFLGIDTFIDFCNYFGGSNMYIPTLKTLENTTRNKNILCEFKQGSTIKALAKKYNLTSNGIRKILKNPRV